MAQEEKFEEAKRLYKTANEDQRYVLESLFPELKGSEDERIKQELIEYFQWATGQYLNDFNNKKVVAWLERQGEQKPVWSEEDTRLLDNCISLIEDIPGTEDEQNWLKGIKDRVQPQPKQEWSEEDETKIKSIIALLKNPAVCSMDGNKGIIDASIKYLKSIKDRVQPPSQWKPSDEQMEVLLSEVKAWTKGCTKQILLESLYNDLKKLKS